MDFRKAIILIMGFIWKVIYFYFVFVENQAFKTYMQLMWNYHTPATSSRLLDNPGQFLV